MHPETAGPVKYYTSPLLATLPGIRHAFPCRSGNPLESLDHLADRMKETFGLTSLLMAKQVHGTGVLIYDGDPGGVELFRKRAFDAIISSTPGIALGIRTADCLPVILAAPGKAVAVAHGGWKGIIGGIMEKAVQTLVEIYRAEPAAIVAAIGPHILSTCYEVGPDVADSFKRRFGESVLKPGRRDRPHLDLETAARLSLQSAGLAPENIDCVRLCTHCLPELFHSYRRDGRPTGRQISFIMRL